MNYRIIGKVYKISWKIELSHSQRTGHLLCGLSVYYISKSRQGVFFFKYLKGAVMPTGLDLHSIEGQQLDTVNSPAVMHIFGMQSPG